RVLQELWPAGVLCGSGLGLRVVAERGRYPARADDSVVGMAIPASDRPPLWIAGPGIKHEWYPVPRAVQYGDERGATKIWSDLPALDGCLPSDGTGVPAGGATLRETHGAHRAALRLRDELAGQSAGCWLDVSGELLLGAAGGLVRLVLSGSAFLPAAHSQNLSDGRDHRDAGIADARLAGQFPVEQDLLTLSVVGSGI